ncbi:MAG: alpha/beta hydrolase [Armatimonadota bacterium]|nr:alpha/beta hydrolase [bacterium]
MPAKKTILRIVALLLLYSISPSLLASDHIEPIMLWPNGAPGEAGDVGKENETTWDHSGPLTTPVCCVTNVSEPTITVYRPLTEKDIHASVIVCPGGGYVCLTTDVEGTEPCQWLNSIGITAILLKYRVPARNDMERYEVALQDVQRAVGMVRRRACEWNIDPNRIGILGFSAGGHLAAVLCSSYEKRAYDPVDDNDQASCRPDFAMLIYAAWLNGGGNSVKLAPELSVSAIMPPTFLACTQDDDAVDGAICYYRALREVKVPVEMHLFLAAGHGYGLRPLGKSISSWPECAEEFMRGLGILSRNTK